MMTTGKRSEIGQGGEGSGEEPGARMMISSQSNGRMGLYFYV